MIPLQPDPNDPKWFAWFAAAHNRLLKALRITVEDEIGPYPPETENKCILCGWYNPMNVEPHEGEPIREPACGQCAEMIGLFVGRVKHG